jgi:hypothetical protein
MQPDVIKELVEAQIPFSVHFPSSKDGDTFVVSIQTALTTKQLAIIAKLGGSIDGQGTCRILTRPNPQVPAKKGK